MRRVKLMPDYQSFPLWEAAGGTVGNIDPSSLPISQTLKDDLVQWAQSFDATLNMDDPAISGFQNVQEENVFIQLGHELGIRLQAELGQDFEVIVKL